MLRGLATEMPEDEWREGKRETAYSFFSNYRAPVHRHLTSFLHVIYLFYRWGRLKVRVFQ